MNLLRGQIMGRGGRREGAGGKPKWKYGKTKVIRVPEALADRVLSFAEFLDNVADPTSVTWSMSDNVTGSKIVNLSGVLVRSLNGNPSIYLSDLVRVGYQIEPERLASNFKVREAKAQGEREESLKSDIQSALQRLNILESGK